MGKAWARQAGTAYVEYFLVATAIVVATIWLWSNGTFQGAADVLQGTFQAQMVQIKGPCVVPEVGGACQ